MKRLIYSIVLILCFGCISKEDLPIITAIHLDWTFKKTNDSLWRSASVPGNIHSDLMNHNLIDDPFISDNALKLNWISETAWEYQSFFTVDEQILLKKHIELDFEGLDTYASVFLNDSLILKTNNAFRKFQVDIKSLLKSENKLRLVFDKASISEDKAKHKLSYSLPEGNRIFTRKAQFQYGWDWGPTLNTSGIWRPITLNAWNDLKIENIHIKQLKLNDSIANLVAEINYKSDLNKDISYEVYVNDSLIRGHHFNPSTYNPGIPFTIKYPKRWWPHNLGKPNLYDIKVVVVNDKTILDSMSTKIGLRAIELVTEKDAIGESFYFKVNGVPVYMKGANYIPQSSLQNKVTDSHYEKLLNDVVDANMNMLRVWGGGIYEQDLFYELCDEKGILVWQDFMFACAMYPGDEAFLENVKLEAEYQIKRLRNHASLALWCGNNENSEGWHRWGWQDHRSEEEKTEIWTNYLKVFDSIIPQTLKQFSPNSSYWESSPKFGRGNPKYKYEGDAHDWWIWHDAYPFEHLEKNVPRFMSEFGFQSFPSYETIRYINQKDSIDISSEAFKTHQKHSRGFQLIDDYMKRDFPVPESAEDYVYMSQLLQAYGITKGIEAHRRAKPYNMGTLYWQLNDCWPAVSWSSIDHLGQWKALHYKAKNAFENVIVSSKVENDTLKTYLINDKLEATKNTLAIQIIDFNGKMMWQDFIDIHLESNSSQLIHQLDLKPQSFNAKEVVVVSTWNEKKYLFYLAKPKELKLLNKELKISVSKTKTGFRIELTSSILQKDVFLFTKTKGHFSNNFFDILPNETRVIEYNTNAESLSDLKLKTLNDFQN